jgi:TolB-like protein/tRNA A-37 threonylcarbamoyl transferase component Bud32
MAVDGLRQGLSDRYTIERELGRGGMATVFLATDAKVSRQVAIKVLHPELAAALGGERFHREIQIATHLTHPNILPVYDSGETDGTLYYVMPFVEGESLRERLDRERQIGINDAIRITCQIASALEYAHRANIVHRDIKPENILIHAGQAVLADFGIARAVTSAANTEALTRTGMSLGTPAYMSPEQAMGERNLDGRSDQYALACVTYEMLAGQPPFTAPTMQALIARHIAEQVPLITTVRASVPDEVQDVVLRALEKVPADRFPTMKDFADALADAASMTMTATSRRATPPRTMRPTTRTNRIAARPAAGMSRKRQVVVAAAGVLFLAGTAVAGVWARHRPAETGSPGAIGFDARRIAVLYLDDMSRDQRLGPLAAGLTESLIDQLDQVRTLDVISRNGVRQFRGTEIDADSVAAVLNAGTVVRGSVEQTGSRLEVQIRLVDGNSGTEIKRARFSRPVTDFLVLRDSLAAEVAGFLRERLGEEVRLRERREGTRSTEAWLLVQRAEKIGRDADELLRSGNQAGAGAELIRADSTLALASRADPTWVEPLVLRGTVAYRRARLTAAPSDANPLMQAALAYAAQALELSANNPKALELRGTVRYQLVNRQIEEEPSRAARLVRDAEQDLRAATNTEPSLATAWYTLSDLYIYNSDFLQAQSAARRAYEEDAYLSAAPRILWQLFSASYELEDFRGADQWCQEGYRRFPKNPQFVRCRLFVLTTPLKTADPTTAWRLVEEWRTLAPAQMWELQGRTAHGLVAIMLARAGLGDSALHVVERSRGTGAIDPDRSLLQYEAYVRLLRGERDEALRLLRQYLTVNPEIRTAMARRYSWWWRDLAKDPRFVAIVGSAG